MAVVAAGMLAAAVKRPVAEIVPFEDGTTTQLAGGPEDTRVLICC